MKECKTRFSLNGHCDKEPCCDAQEVECCGDCFHFNNCSSACHWFVQKMEEVDEEMKRGEFE